MIELNRNPLQTFPKAINLLPKLQYADFSGTSITTITYDKDIFNQNVKQMHFYMMPNLKIIDDCAFCNFPNLKELSFLENPKFSYIHENAFGASSLQQALSLETLVLRSCNLSTIPQKLLNWKTVTKLNVGNNPYVCNCSLTWIIDELKSIEMSKKFVHFGYLEQDLQCYYPDELRGVLIQNATEEDFCGKGNESTLNIFFLFFIITILLLFMCAIGIQILKSRFWNPKHENDLYPLQRDFHNETKF